MMREASDLSRAAVCAEADDGRRVFGRVERLEIRRPARNRDDVPSRPVGSRRVLVFFNGPTPEFATPTKTQGGWPCPRKETPRAAFAAAPSHLSGAARRGARARRTGASLLARPIGSVDRARGREGARGGGRSGGFRRGAVARRSFPPTEGTARKKPARPPREFDSPATTRAFARRPRPRARPRSRARSGFGSGSSARAPSLGASAPRARRGRLLARGGPSSLLDPRSSPARGIHTSGVFCV